MVFFLVIGVLSLTLGLLSLCSKKFKEYLTAKLPDSNADKELFGERNLYFIRWYSSGIVEIIIGIAALAIYIQSNKQLLNALTSLLHISL
jgi:uncharacterized membrane protein YkgB